MKIISKYKDYWEYLITQYGKDNKKHNIPTWVRNTLAIEDNEYGKIRDDINQRLLQTSKVRRSWAKTRNYYELFNNKNNFILRYEIVIIAGISYPVITISIYDTKYDEPKKVNYFYTKLDIRKYILNLQNINVSKYIHSSKDDIKLLLKYTDEYLDSSSSFKYDFVTAGNLYIKNPISSILNSSYNKDILLGDVKFYKSDLDIQMIFQEIEMYVNYNFNVENKIVEVDNRTIATKHGFNCQSFKTRTDYNSCKFKK